MSYDWLSGFQAEGYAVVRDVIDHTHVRVLRAAFSEASGGAIRREGAVYASRRALDLPAVREWAISNAALDLARAVLGPDAQPVRGILFDKNSDANWPVAWHQDVTLAVRQRRDLPGYGPWSVKAGVPHVQPPVAVLERMVTLRLHLDDCPASNGALRLIPESHRSGKLDRATWRSAVEAASPVTCEALEGDVVLMRPLTLHSSSPSKSPSHRRVVHVEYAAGAPGDGLEWAEQVSLAN